MQALILVSLLSMIACSTPTKKSVSNIEVRQSFIDSAATTIEKRFLAPDGYKTVESNSNSFAAYLQTLPLKPMGTTVKYYTGDPKINREVYCSVIDQDIDPVDLQQCADAVMRLRGEYLFKQKKYKEIHFNFLSDGKPRHFTDYAKGDYSYAKFRKYMKYIFSYANTASLRAELKVRFITDMQIGDVLIQKGNPYGHAVLVVNMAKDSTGNTVYMLAQSYMPAQETQILINRNSKSFSPWYPLKEGEIITPEWRFTSADLRHFD
jgi:hypothetical protein